MSVISTIYDNLNSVITTLFPNKIELKNPYNVSDNPDVILRIGYGITWETGAYSEVLNGRVYYVERNIGIIFTKRIFRTDLNKTARRDIEKSLFEDSKTLIDEIKTNPLIIEPVEYFEYSNDDGIDFVIDGKQNIVSLKTNFVVKYSVLL